jgi:hypothetical protein
MPNRMLKRSEFVRYVRQLARKYKLDKFCDGVIIAGVQIRWNYGKKLPTKKRANKLLP